MKFPCGINCWLFAIKNTRVLRKKLNSIFFKRLSLKAFFFKLDYSIIEFPIRRFPLALPTTAVAKTSQRNEHKKHSYREPKIRHANVQFELLTLKAFRCWSCLLETKHIHTKRPRLTLNKAFQASKQIRSLIKICDSCFMRNWIKLHLKTN